MGVPLIGKSNAGTCAQATDIKISERNKLIETSLEQEKNVTKTVLIQVLAYLQTTSSLSILSC
jgi:hypothetical protein